MKLKELLFLLITSLLLSSCIKNEAANTEADIETCTVPENILIAEPVIENDRVDLLVAPGSDVTKLALEFTLTPGATIEPPSGTPRDFTSDQKYTVTSEDKEWSKTYTVSCIIYENNITKYGFEHVKVNTGGYHEFYLDATGKASWANGNPGFKIVNIAKKPEDYPTSSTPNGKVGKGVKLVTRTTGEYGNNLKMPLAAGNLFIGRFVTLMATVDALKATRFGTPFNAIPDRLTGYYKYKAGSEFYNRDKQLVPGKEDSFDIYAMFYETDSKVKYLDGTNSLTSPNLISIARIEGSQKKETNEWTYFDLPFNMLEGKTIDPEKLANNQYNLSIVFTSSIDGAYFEGAIGSTLEIDEVEIVLLDEENE